MTDRIVMGAMRSHMVPDLKMYIDLAKLTNRTELEGLMTQWVQSQPYKRNMFRSTGGSRYTNQMGDSPSTTSGSSFKKPITCFSCGKLGHMSRECRFKPQENQTQNSSSSPKVETKPIVCFICKEVGHKYPQCPKKIKDKVKKISIQADRIEQLEMNNVMANVGDMKISMTFDTGQLYP